MLLHYLNQRYKIKKYFYIQKSETEEFEKSMVSWNDFINHLADLGETCTIMHPFCISLKMLFFSSSLIVVLLLGHSVSQLSQATTLLFITISITIWDEKVSMWEVKE